MKESTKTIKDTPVISDVDKILTTDTAPAVADKPAIPLAKSGKRSEKSIKIDIEKQEKEDRKKISTLKLNVSADTASKITKPIRTKMDRRSKGYKKVSILIDSSKLYPLPEAVDLLLKTNPVKFDATVELHVNLGVDPRQADQNIRQTVVLPSGTGKTIKVAVFADNDDIEKAKKAGADIAGGDEFLQQLDKGIIDFDILISTPSMMAKLAKYARILGPKGLMPNPKSGTVAPNISKAVTEAKTGRVEFRVDSTGIVHIGIGKLSFGADKIIANLSAVMNIVKTSKPANLKGIYIKSVFLTSSMGPSIKLDLAA